MTFVPRTKNDRKKGIDNRRVKLEARAVTLACGCEKHTAPELSNPPRFWCCGGWRRAR